MRPAPLRWVLAAAFGVAFGHLAWHAGVGPARPPEYVVAIDGPALFGTDPSAKHLYLRRELHLPRRPRHAWVEVAARDRVRLYVNGRFVAARSLDGADVAVAADLTPYLRDGANVIAVSAKRGSAGGPPAAAVRGGYTLDDGEHPIGVDAGWRCGAAFERGAAWWMTAEFDDRHWPPAAVVPAAFRAEVPTPPRAATEPGTGRWITPPDWADGVAAVRREFEVGGTPASGWLRVTTAASYRLAVNGVILDVQEDALGTDRPASPARRSYDITPLVRRGRNEVALLLTSAVGPPRLLADLEVADAAGDLTRVGTDEHWLCRPGGRDWLRDTDESGTWEPCDVTAGDLGVAPWQGRREFVAAELPLHVRLYRAAGQLYLMALCGWLAHRACRWAAPRLVAAAGTTSPAPVAHLALVLPTLGIAAAVLASYDPRVAGQDVYGAVWVVLAVAAVPLQWWLVAAVARRRPDGFSAPVWGEWARRWGTTAAVVGLVAVAFGLRLRDLEREPFHWDEVDHYRLTRGALLRGFPSQVVPPGFDLPAKYTDTSELLYVSLVASALVFEDDRYVVRFPAVCWGTLTVLLVYHVGRRLFGPAAGLLAAAVCAVGPTCVGMSCFGRYFAQLQFLTLLTVYGMWLTVRRPGALDRRALALTAAGFAGMYLTWQGAGLMAPVLALAALVHARHRLATLIGTRAVWLAVAAVVLVIVLQQSHRTYQQTQFLRYAISLSSLKPTPMWGNPLFRPWYYVWQGSWGPDALLPMLGLAGGVLLTVTRGYKAPARFLLVNYVGGCLALATLLPVSAPRYVYHLTPLLALLGAAAVAAGVRALVRPFRAPGTPAVWRGYAAGVGAATAGTALALGCGWLLRLDGMPALRVEGYRPGVLEFPDLEGPAAFLRGRIQDGDVLLLSHPPLSHHLMGGDRPDWSRDYSPLTTLRRSVTLDDRGAVPLNPYDGTVTISTLDGVRDLFARNRRVWYVVVPSSNERQNHADVSAFLRQHMDVVYEDYDALVLFRGDRHRPAAQRQKDDRKLQDARGNFLP